MYSIVLCFAVAALWALQGIGFLRRLAPSLKGDGFAAWVLAAWLGLILELLVLCLLYFLIPGPAVASLAWPVALGLCAASLALWWGARGGPSSGMDGSAWGVLGLSVFAVLLLLRPLAVEAGPAFYFSNNGEFSNYAVLGDVVQHQDAKSASGSPEMGPDGLFLPGAVPQRTREGVAGLLIAKVSSLSGKAALWVTEPFSAAVSFLFFCVLGCLFRHFFRLARPGPLAAVAFFLPYAWAVLSAASQQYWTSSWLSQYLSIALYTGTFAFIVIAPTAGLRRMAVLGLAVGASAPVYPEMFILNTGMLGLLEIVVQRGAGRAWRSILLGLAAALAVAVLCGNLLAYDLLAQRLLKSPAGNFGWNVYGPHRPILPFISSVIGARNIFSGPHSSHLAAGTFTSLLLLAALAFALKRLAGRAQPSRGVDALTLTFALGLAGLFAIVAKRGLGLNYMAIKFIFGFGWIAYLSIALLTLEWTRVPRRWVLAVGLAGAFVTFDLARGAAIFSNFLARSAPQAMFTEAEGLECREKAGQAKDIYVAAPWFNYAIIGQFLALGGDLVRQTGVWPDGREQAYTGQRYLLVLGEGFMNFKLEDDKKIKGKYQPFWAGRNFELRKAAKAPGK